MKSSLVVIPTTLGILYVQISSAIIETHILLNIVKGKHDSLTKNAACAYVFKVNC